MGAVVISLLPHRQHTRVPNLCNPPSIPLQSTEAQGLVPTTIPYNLDWTANSIGDGILAILDVRGLSHSQKHKSLPLGCERCSNHGTPLTTKRHLYQ